MSDAIHRTIPKPEHWFVDKLKNGTITIVIALATSVLYVNNSLSKLDDKAQRNREDLVAIFAAQKEAAVNDYQTSIAVIKLAETQNRFADDVKEIQIQIRELNSSMRNK